MCLICFIFYEQMSFVTNSDPLVKLPLDAQVTGDFNKMYVWAKPSIFLLEQSVFN